MKPLTRLFTTRAAASGVLTVLGMLAVGAVSAQTALNAAGEGRRAFLQYNCYSCHGMYAAGGMGPNIVHAERGDIMEAVMKGESGGMPSFRRQLTSADVANLAAYLRSIGTPSEPTFMDWWVPVPPK